MKKFVNQNQTNEQPKNSRPNSINPFIFIVFILLLGLQACNKKNCDDDGSCPDICETDPCGNPTVCHGQCPVIEDGTLSKSKLKGEGNVVETDDGMSVDGKLTITTPNNEEVVLEDAKITVKYNDDGTVKSMEGTASVPSPTDYMEFTNPVQADLGYYSGKYLN